jgi:hypothetical protein
MQMTQDTPTKLTRNQLLARARALVPLLEDTVVNVSECPSIEVHSQPFKSK